MKQLSICTGFTGNCFTAQMDMTEVPVAGVVTEPQA